MLSRSVLSQLISSARYQRMSPEQVFAVAVDERAFGLSGWQAESSPIWAAFWSCSSRRLAEPQIKAGELLDWMVETLDYLEYFQDYYGKGEHAEEKKYAVVNFIQYVTQLHLSPLQPARSSGEAGHHPGHAGRRADHLHHHLPHQGAGIRLCRPAAMR